MLAVATSQTCATTPWPPPPYRPRPRASAAPLSVVRPFALASNESSDTGVLSFTSQINYAASTPAHNCPLKAEVIYCVRGAISPLLANLFLHYAFDMWMARTYPHIPFERYADDIICHCKSAEEARELWSALADRFAACKLVLHPQKTKIVYCKDANRRGDFPSQSFDFLGFSFRARKTLWQGDIHTHGFLPAARPKALTSISRAIRRWALHHHSDKSLQDLAKMYNPYIEGWINYYGHFYRTHLRPTLKRIDAYVIRWARRKFKRLRHKTKGARDWFERLRRVNPSLFAHWQLCHGNGRTSGAV